MDIAHSTAAQLRDIVKDQMEAHGVSTRYVAEATGIARTTLTRHLITGDLTIKELEAIASVIGTTDVELLATARKQAA